MKSRYEVPILIFFSCLINGCWAGHRVPENELGDKHPSVEWVYKAGGQLSLMVYILFPVSDSVLYMEYEKNYLIVTEGCLYSEFTYNPWKASFILDLQTGKPFPVLLRKYSYEIGPSGTWDEKNQRYTCPVNQTLCIVVQKNEISFGKLTDPPETYTKILKMNDMISFVNHPLLLSNHLMVFQAGSDYIVCVDTKKLPEYESLLQSSDSCLDKK